MDEHLQELQDRSQKAKDGFKLSIDREPVSFMWQIHDNILCYNK